MPADQSFRDIVTAAAAKYGINPNLLLGIAHVESSDGTDTRVSKAGAKGPFQFTPKTAKAYGLDDPTDLAASADAAARFARDNIAGLTKKLGRSPTNGEVYLAHQQGVDGASNLILNPKASAASLVGSDRVTQNGGTADMTGEQFAGKWTNLFDGTKANRPSSGGGGSPAAPTLADLLPGLKAGPSQSPSPGSGTSFGSLFGNNQALFKPLAPLGPPPPPPPLQDSSEPVALAPNPTPMAHSAGGPLDQVRQQLQQLTQEAKQRYL